MIENSTTNTAVIIGSSGLVGKQVLNLLLKDKEIQKVKALVRKQMPVSHPKLEQIVVDFSDLEAFKKTMIGGNILYCAVGTTLKKVKSDKEAYRKVDFDIPVNAARFAKYLNYDHFSLISAVGANATSGNFYLKLKGQVEKTIEQLELRSVAFFRPSFLLGDRNEFRLAETISKVVFKLFSFLVPSKYQAVKDKVLAKSMIKKSIQKAPGTNVYHYKEIVS